MWPSQRHQGPWEIWKCDSQQIDTPHPWLDFKIPNWPIGHHRNNIKDWFGLWLCCHDSY